MSNKKKKKHRLVLKSHLHNIFTYPKHLIYKYKQDLALNIRQEKI